MSCSHVVTVTHSGRLHIIIHSRVTEVRGPFVGTPIHSWLYLVISRKLEELESGMQDLSTHLSGVIHSH